MRSIQLLSVAHFAPQLDKAFTEEDTESSLFYGPLGHHPEKEFCDE